MKNMPLLSEPFVSMSPTLESAREFRNSPLNLRFPQTPFMPDLSVAESRMEGYRGDRYSWLEGAWLGKQGWSAYSSATITRDGDAGFFMARDRAVNSRAGFKNRGDADLFIGHDRATGSGGLMRVM